MRAIGILCGCGSLLKEAEKLGLTIEGNLETRTPYSTGRHISWDLNFPGVPLVRFPDEAIMKEDRWHGADLAIGHPPCGSHSQLGNSGQPFHKTTEERRAMQAVRHKRVGLIPFFVDKVNEFQPLSFALDNLPKIMETITPPEWWETVLPDYHLTYIVMLNWDYGTPQLRKRLWVVGVRKPMPKFNFKAPMLRVPGPRSIYEACFGLPWQPWHDIPELGHVHVPPNRMLTGDYRTTVEGYHVDRATDMALGYMSIPPGRAWPYITSRGRLAVKIGRARLEDSKYSRTITGLPSVHHPLTGFPLTGRERARIMNWDDDFHLGTAETTYDRTTLMRQTLLTGKAVPSGFPRYMLPQLMKHVRRHSR